jgi:hypothetical protein
LITNSIRYFQRCEGVRPDVQLVDQSMLTYPWFVRVQSPNFPHFTFPGTNYHPFTPGSFSIRQLVEANMDDGKGELFMAGGWNPQDDSHVGHFQQLPVGYVDRIVRTGRSELDEDVIRYLRRHVAHLPNFTLPERTFGDVRPPARSHCIMHRVSSTALCIVCRPLHHASCVVHCIMHRVSSTASCIVCRPLHHASCVVHCIIDRILGFRSQERWEAVAIKDYYQARHKLAFAVLSWAAAHADQVRRNQSNQIPHTKKNPFTTSNPVEILKKMNDCPICLWLLTRIQSIEPPWWIQLTWYGSTRRARSSCLRCARRPRSWSGAWSATRRRCRPTTRATSASSTR